MKICCVIAVYLLKIRYIVIFSINYEFEIVEHLSHILILHFYSDKKLDKLESLNPVAFTAAYYRCHRPAL